MTSFGAAFIASTVSGLAARSMARIRLVAAAALACVFAVSPAGATWQQDIGTFRIGVVAERGSGNTITGLEALKKAYTLALGMPVEFFVASDYRTLIDAQAKGKVQYGVYSATAYAAASLSCQCVTPIAAPTGANGALGIRSVLLTRTEGFASLADVPAHRVALAGADSLTGYQLPVAALKAAGVDIANGASFLVQATTPSEAEQMFLSGAVDAVFGWIETAANTTPIGNAGSLERFKEAGLPDPKVIWTSQLVRFGPHALSAGLDPEIARRLTAFLANVSGADPDVFDLIPGAGEGGFVAVSASDYDPVVEALRSFQKAAD